VRHGRDRDQIEELALDTVLADLTPKEPGIDSTTPFRELARG
jgi:hypothetical protein